MRKFLVSIICAVFILMCNKSNGQNSFPNNWKGNYKGELLIYGVDSVKMKLKMKLDVVKLSDSTYQWRMTYVFNGKEDIRDYLLIEKDVKKGHFIIDERNSILIDGYYKSGIFTSFFKVSNAFIISTYSKIKDTILFEIISGSDKDVQKSGGQKIENQEIPEVTSYLVNGRQKAILIKQ